MKNKKLVGIIIAIVVAALAVFILMDTFVIQKVYTTVPPENPSQTADTDNTNTPSPESNAGTQTDLSTENSYEDENISITITDYREYDTNIHVADVQLSSPEYLKTAFANSAYGQNIIADTSETAQSVNAIFAVNGDYYGAREDGYVLRNGVLYRNTSAKKEDLVIYNDGSFAMIKEGEISAEQLLEDGAKHVLSFGPVLVRDSEVDTSKSETKNPRTAIGLMDDLHYIFVVTDGRTDDSDGLTYFQLAEFMQSLGVKYAYNLDGGGSSAMYFNGNVVNTIHHGNERAVSDIVYIGY